MAYDPRATVYVGPLHAGLRCIPSTMMDYPARIAEKEQKGSSKGFYSVTLPSPATFGSATMSVLLPSAAETFGSVNGMVACEM